MNEWEKSCARELLGALEGAEILDLAKTVTKSKFQPQDKQEGIELILKYETDVKSLLSRKKVTSKVLTQYLHDKGMKFNIDGSKLSLCDAIQQMWASSTPAPTTVSPVQVPVGLSETDVVTLGRQFVEWFFSQLGTPGVELVGVDSKHFFSDASTRVQIGEDIHEGVGKEGCAGVLTECLKMVGGAVPVPNVDQVVSEASPHGAIRVLSCGTLHASHSRMLGAFEQIFLLVRDPTTPDNWKIKFTELRLKAKIQLDLTSLSQPSIQY